MEKLNVDSNLNSESNGNLKVEKRCEKGQNVRGLHRPRCLVEVDPALFKDKKEIKAHKNNKVLFEAKSSLRKYSGQRKSVWLAEEIRKVISK